MMLYSLNNGQKLTLELMKIHGGHKKMKSLKNQIMKRTSLFICTLLFISSILFYPRITFAYPFWAQQNYESPREATGKIVCANCHLAQMPTIAEVPQSVGADSVFKAVVKIPYKNDLKRSVLMVLKSPYKLVLL